MVVVAWSLAPWLLGRREAMVEEAEWSSCLYATSTLDTSRSSLRDTA